MKRLILAIFLLSTSLFANIYTLKPIKITKDKTCVIGDFNPPAKSNKGFVLNMCYVDTGDSLVVLDAGPTCNFADGSMVSLAFIKSSFVGHIPISCL